MPDAADIAADDGSALPHGLRDRQPEAFAQGLLQHNRRAALQCVDQRRIIRGNHDDALAR
jgi:hypothetical protein